MIFLELIRTPLLDWFKSYGIDYCKQIKRLSNKQRICRQSCFRSNFFISGDANDGTVTQFNLNRNF